MDVEELKRQSAAIFDIFHSTTETCFSFLVTEFGYTLDSTTVDESMAFVDMLTHTLHYRNATTEIKVMYTWYDDLRGSPQLIIGRLNPTDDGSLTVKEGYNIEMLIAERCPDRALRAFAQDPVERLGTTLQAFASIVAECARPELTGDFSLFPRLREVLMDELKGAVFLHSGVDGNDLIEHLERETS